MKIRTLFFILIVPVCGPVSEVTSACQPYKPNPAFLNEIRTEAGMKRVFPRQSPEQKETLMALVRNPNPSPDQIPELAHAEFWWRVAPGGMDGLSTSSRGRIETTLKDRDYYIRNAVKAEFDPHGNGKFDQIQDGNGTYTYAAPGEYRPTLRIYEASGLAYTERTIVKVMSEEAFDAQIRGIWNDMKEALKRNDVSAALECVYSQSRPRHNEWFQEITKLKQNVDKLFGSLRWAETSSYGPVNYRDTLTDQEVRFVRDVDGAWRKR